MRYLTRSFAVGALRRGKGIEQFLGPVDVAGDPWIPKTAPQPFGNVRVALAVALVQLRQPLASCNRRPITGPAADWEPFGGPN